MSTDLIVAKMKTSWRLAEERIVLISFELGGAK